MALREGEGEDRKERGGKKVDCERYVWWVREGRDEEIEWMGERGKDRWKKEKKRFWVTKCRWMRGREIENRREEREKITVNCFTNKMEEKEQKEMNNKLLSYHSCLSSPPYTHVTVFVILFTVIPWTFPIRRFNCLTILESFCIWINWSATQSISKYINK